MSPAGGQHPEGSDWKGRSISLELIDVQANPEIADQYSAQSVPQAFTNKDAFEADIVSEVMEGGFTTEEFMEQNKDSMKTAPDVLDIAMILETQALDLYLRYSEKAKDEKSKTVLYNIAEEEKAHLKALGHLMEQRA